MIRLENKKVALLVALTLIFHFRTPAEQLGVHLEFGEHENEIITCVLAEYITNIHVEQFRSK